MSENLEFYPVTINNAHEFWALFIEQAKEQGAEKYVAGTLESFKDSLNHTKSTFFFLTKWNDDVVGGFGYDLTYSIFQTALVMKAKSIYVLPSFRGKGFARAMMTERGRRAKSLDCVRIEADVIKENIVAQEFLKSMGFEKEKEPFLQFSAQKNVFKTWLDK